jgi:acyl-CoA reductase-like NAD-dependent aldehyde dehydrogenase
VQAAIHDRFMQRAVARTKQIVEGNPLDAKTMIGAQASNDQLEAPLGMRFLTRSRVFDEAEQAWLDACPPARGPQGE